MERTNQPKPRAGDYNDPDVENSEQNERGTQAQDVADGILKGEIGVEDSEPGSRANPADLVPRDVPDLVDTMESMVRSGRIDRGAFAGEEPMDDEDEDQNEDEE